MSGHSKWATIKRQKEVADRQRGKIFSKLAREIAIAARDGDDPKTNFKLRLALQKAKQANMPKDNIIRAIKKGSGEIAGERWEEVVFEGYGPAGIGIIVEAVTDNKNRTTAEIKNIFERGGGSLTSPGAVSFQFKKSGLITVGKTDSVDEQVLKLIDLGAEDIQEESDALEVFTLPERLKEVQDKIERAGFTVKNAEMTMKAVAILPINDQRKADRVLKFMETLEEHDDVQKVYANFDISNEILSNI